jgi:hypothetical protein
MKIRTPILGGYSVNEQLDQIRRRQGISNTSVSTRGSILGTITATVGGTGNRMLFSGDVTIVTPPSSNTDTWTITGLSDYNIVVTLIGTGILSETTDYTVTGDVITRVGNMFYNGEVYTILLIQK